MDFEAGQEWILVSLGLFFLTGGLSSRRQSASRAKKYTIYRNCL